MPLPDFRQFCPNQVRTKDCPRLRFLRGVYRQNEAGDEDGIFVLTEIHGWTAPNRDIFETVLMAAIEDWARP